MMSVEHASAGYQANTEDDAETTVVLLEAIPQEDDVEDVERARKLSNFFYTDFLFNIDEKTVKSI